MTRRTLLRLSAATGLSAAAPSLLGLGRAAHAAEVPAPVLTDDGLYKQPWFLESFLDLAEDLTLATDQGKRFAVMWELKGCPYCKETHFTNFADPDIHDFVSTHFDILQLNIIGSRLVSDFDGEELSEKDLAGKYGVRFTPTIQFFPEGTEGLRMQPAQHREVTRMPGYFRPPHFLAMFKFVDQKAYNTQDFRAFLRQDDS
jgi:thioredoxin-related protein